MIVAYLPGAVFRARIAMPCSGMGIGHAEAMIDARVLDSYSTLVKVIVVFLPPLRRIEAYGPALLVEA